MDGLRDTVRACSACHYRVSCHAPVPGVGPVPSKLMAIGEAPGKDEDLYGEPFVGAAGRLLDSLLSNVGVKRSDVYITNVVKCRPPNNADPTAASVRACAKWLDAELDEVSPSVVLLMGGRAMSRVLGSRAGTVEHLHGRPIAGNGVVYLPCYHPAAALYETSQLRYLYDDFQVLKGLLSGRSPESFLVVDQYPSPVYQEVGSSSELDGVLALVSSAGQVAADVETVNGRLWSVQLCVEPGSAWFIGPELLSGFRVPDGVKVILHNYLYDIGFIKVDRFADTMVMAYLLGLPQGLKELASRICGMVMESYSELVSPLGRDKAIGYLDPLASMVWPDPEPVADLVWDNKAGRVIEKVRRPQPIGRKIKKILSDCAGDSNVDPCRRWRDIDARERKVVEGVSGSMPEATIADLPRGEAVEYGCRDADATMRVHRCMLPRIGEMGLGFVLDRVDLPSIPMVSEMMGNGIALDIGYLRGLSSQYSERMAAIADQLAKDADQPFNPGSSPQVASVVYGKLGFVPTKYTSTGMVSTDDKELKKVKHPVVKGILNYRKLAKNKDSFADSLLAKAVVGGDGVVAIHTTLKVTRTETGRLSSSDPNLQAQPVRTKEGRAVRNGFIARLGFVLMEGDMPQEEIRVMAHESQCPALLGIFHSGGDPHTETASRIFGVPLDVAKQEKYRYPTKRLNFGVIYDISPEGLSEEIGEYIADLALEGIDLGIRPWSVDDCGRLIQEWYRLYPEVKDFRMEKVAQARRLGYVTDMFGRIRFVPEVFCPIRSIQEAGARQAGNMPIQSGSAGIIKLAMARLYRERDELGWRSGARFLLQIHDALLLEVRDDSGFIKQVAAWLGDVMANTVSLSVPLGPVDVKVGHRWGEMGKLDGEG